MQMQKVLQRLQHLLPKKIYVFKTPHKAQQKAHAIRSVVVILLLRNHAAPQTQSFTLDRKA
jgi:hypothetical protein